MQERLLSVVERSDETIVSKLNDAHLTGPTLAHFLKTELLELLEGEREILIVDFENVKSLSTTVIGSFLHVIKRTPGGARRLRLCAMSETLRGIFRTLNLDGVFAIFDTVEDAKKSQRYPLPEGPITPKFEGEDTDSGNWK